jgi:hypothetical protein
MVRAKKDDQTNRDFFAMVGELVLISSALDHLINRVLIAVMDLGDAPLLESVVATLEPVRKVEILKQRASHISNETWKKKVTKFCDKVESVFRQRNTACHTPPFLQDGVWTFPPIAAAKMLRNLDLPTKKLRPFSAKDFSTAISTGEEALGAGEILIENFKNLNVETKKRLKVQASNRGE